MASGRKGKSGQSKRKASRQRPASQGSARMPLAAHRAYAPLLGMWGALLGAGVVVVLPMAMVEQMLRGTLIGSWAAAAQPALAWLVGGLLGGLLFAFAAHRHIRARRGVRGYGGERQRRTAARRAVRRQAMRAPAVRRRPRNRSACRAASARPSPSAAPPPRPRQAARPTCRAAAHRPGARRVAYGQNLGWQDAGGSPCACSAPTCPCAPMPCDDYPVRATARGAPSV